MLGKNLAGAAAKNAVNRLLRTNIITSTVTTTAMTLPDFYKALVSNKISWKQFAKNFAVNVSGVAGGVAGTYGGTTLGGIVGSAIGTIIAPGPGTAIGAKIGSAIGGIAGGVGLGMGSAIGFKKILDQLAEDDAKSMFSIAQDAIVDLAIDYLITEDEFKIIENQINKIITAKWLENMYQSGYKKEDKLSVQLMFAYEHYTFSDEEKQKLQKYLQEHLELEKMKTISMVIRNKYPFTVY